MERYKTKDLFLHLVSPTIIVILTVIQVHYFHKRFIASMNQPTEVVERDSEERVRHKSRTTSRVAESEGLEFVESAGNLIRLFLKRCRHKTEVFFKHFKGVIWRLLELHWIKVVYITAFVCAVSEVSEIINMYINFVKYLFHYNFSIFQFVCRSHFFMYPS